MESHQPVDVLGRIAREHKPTGLPEDVHASVLDIGLRQPRCAAKVADVGALQQQRVDICGRPPEESFHQAGLAPMCSQVPGVLESTAPCFDQDCVGIERAVVHQVRSHREGPKLHRPTVAQVSSGTEIRASRREEKRLFENALGRLSDVQRDRRVNARCQAVVVRMAMGDDDAEQRGVVGLQSRDRGEGHVLLEGRVKWEAYIEHQASAVMLELDA